MTNTYELHYIDRVTGEKIVVMCNDENMREKMREMPFDRYHFCYMQDTKPAEPLAFMW